MLTLHTPTGLLSLSPEPGISNLAELLRHHNLPLNTRCGGRGLCSGCLVHVDSPSTPLLPACQLHPRDLTTVHIPQRSLARFAPAVHTRFSINIPTGFAPLSTAPLGVAVDVGTTTVALLLLDLATGDTLSSQSAFNDQIHLGEDVLTRIQHASAGPSQLEELRTAILHRTLLPLLSAALTETNRPPTDIGAITVAGNTTMLHLLLGVDPTSLGIAPFTPTFLDHRTTPLQDLFQRPTAPLSLIATGCQSTPTPTEPLPPPSCPTDASPLAAPDPGAPSLRAPSCPPEGGSSCSSCSDTPPLLTAPEPHAPPLRVDSCRPAIGGADSCDSCAPSDPVVPVAGACGAPRKTPVPRLGFNTTALAHLLPGASAYVGADIVAGVLVTGMTYDPGPSLLVDVGTNGEIVLHHAGQLLGTATAAGPAFEGAGLSSGMRAGTGAVESIDFEERTLKPRLALIGTDDPRDAVGICGSGYIDLLATARAAGLLSPTARILLPPDPRPPAHPAQRLNDQATLLLARGRHGTVTVTDADLAKLLTAKAAIAAGITVLLRRAGLEPRHIHRLYLAGGFGAHLSIPHAIAIGLLPGFSPEQVQVVGNTSLAGAMLTLLDKDLLPQLSQLAGDLTPVELNHDPDFEDEFISSLNLP